MIVRCQLVAICILVYSQVCLADSPGTKSSEQIESGQKLFKHQWTKNDPLSATGDGLGPVFNGRSCIQCHYQSGTGGGGSNEQNVDVLSVQVPKKLNGNRRAEFTGELTSLHRGFQAPTGVIPSITLHAHGTNKDYYDRRQQLLSKVSPTDDDAKALREVIQDLIGTADHVSVPIEFEHTQRNTPALYGAGLIDRVSEKDLERTRKRSSQRYPQVSGRVARIQTGTADDSRRVTRGTRRRRNSSLVMTDSFKGRVGRFGWRGQISTLDEFVRGACANELGLAVSTQPQPVDPTSASLDNMGLDLTDRQCRELTSFVASLPAPKPEWPTDDDQRKIAEHGRLIFDQVGCNACHVERLGQAEFVYSDLLLHDMGSSLSDPLPAPSETSVSTLPGYYGGLQTIFSTTPLAQTRREWRTPPLWGSADSAPYMHDGRAATFNDAILAHGGEAKFCVTNFIRSSPKDRIALLAFLETLKAPQSQSVAAKEPDSNVVLAARR